MNETLSTSNNKAINDINENLGFDKLKCIKYKNYSLPKKDHNHNSNEKNIYGFGYLFQTLKNLVSNEKSNNEIKIGNNKFKRSFFYSIHGPQSCGKTTFVKNFCKIFLIDLLIIDIQFLDSISKDIYFLPNLKQFLSNKTNKIYLVFRTCDNLFESRYVESFIKTSIYQFFEFLKKQKKFMIFFNCVMSYEDLQKSEFCNTNMMNFIEIPYFYEIIPTKEKTKIIKKFFKSILKKVQKNQKYINNDVVIEDYSTLLKKYENSIKEESTETNNKKKRKKKLKKNSKNKKIKTIKQENGYNNETLFNLIPENLNKSNVNMNEILKNNISNSEKLITINENDKFEYTYCDVICDQIINKVLLFTSYYLYTELIEIFEDYLYHCSMNFNQIIYDNNNKTNVYYNDNYSSDNDDNEDDNIISTKIKIGYYYYILDQKNFFDYIKLKFEQLSIIQQTNHIHYNKNSELVINSYRCQITTKHENVSSNTLSFDLNIQIIEEWEDSIAVMCICGEHILNEKIYVPKISGRNIIKKKIQVSTFKLPKGYYTTIWATFKNNILLQSFSVSFEVF